MMWRGSTLSFLLHGGVFFGLIFGLPALPEIFDRKKIVLEDTELPVTVEVVSAEEVDRLLDVITPDRVEQPRRDATSGKLAPLAIAKQRSADDPQSDTGGQPNAASASDRRLIDKDGDAGGSRKTRIPEGQLNQQKIEQSKRQRASELRKQQKRPNPAIAESTPPAAPSTEVEKSTPANSTPANSTPAESTLADRTPAPRDTERPNDARARTAPTEAREGEDARPETDPTAESKPVEVAQEERQLQDAEPVQTAESRRVRDARDDRPPQSAQQSTRSETERASAAQTPSEEATVAEPATASPEQTETAAIPAAEIRPLKADAAQRQAVRETDKQPVQPPPQETSEREVPAKPTENAEAKNEKTKAEQEVDRTQQPDTLNDFVQSVSGKNREVVLKMLAADRRLLKTIQPSQPEVSAPEEAREKSITRLEQAAQQGFPAAQYNLAGKLLRGEDMKKDVTEAQKWLTRAAEQGHVPAQTLLGLMRFTGIGLPRDLAETAFWWSLASDRGSESARVGSELVQPQLSPREDITAKRLRSRWGTLITDLSEAAAGTTNLDSLNKDLRDAAQNGDIQAVLSLLARGADADSTGEEGRSAVINAAWRGREQIIRLLLRRGADTELTDDTGATPLIWAAINGHARTAKGLLDSGANPNHRDHAGRTALMRAAWNGHRDVVEALIAAGAQVGVTDRAGTNALGYALREGHADIVALLRAAGAR